MRVRNNQDAVNSTNLSAMTRYYPDSTGFDVKNIDRMLVDMVCSGGVTVTVEAHSSDETVPTFVDITETVWSKKTGVDSAASFIDQTDLLLIKDMLFDRLRVKYVTADTSNAVYLRAKTESENTITS